VLDVRSPSEIALGAIPGALPTPLPRLVEALASLDPTRPTVVYCSGGTRSAVAASVLASKGFADVSDVLGGFEAWRAETVDAA
jgi:rhodanese-related sulfurtransferase